MNLVSLKNQLNDRKNNLAFVVGNGINRFDNPTEQTSWENLLLVLWEKCALDKQTQIGVMKIA